MAKDYKKYRCSRAGATIRVVSGEVNCGYTLGERGCVLDPNKKSNRCLIYDELEKLAQTSP